MSDFILAWNNKTWVNESGNVLTKIFELQTININTSLMKLSKK